MKTSTGGACQIQKGPASSTEGQFQDYQVSDLVFYLLYHFSRSYHQQGPMQLNAAYKMWKIPMSTKIKVYHFWH